MMTDPVLVLKAHARILHRDVKNGEKAAIKRISRHRELSMIDEDKLPEKIRRRHCLSQIAVELGFKGWPHLLQVMKQSEPNDFGTFFYPPRCRVHWNIWFASYDEAEKVRKEHGGYLLAYKHQFIVVDEDYIKSLGVNPSDPELKDVGRDWVKPASDEAKKVLYGKLIEVTLDRAG